MARYTLILAAACGFMISAVSGLFIVPFLHKLHFGQTIKEIGPTWHNKKQGTPTMGGLCFILGTVFAVCLALTSLLHGSPELMGGPDSRGLYLAIFSAFGFGLIGFLDDFIKVVKKRNLGLRAWQKIVGQLLVTTALLAGLWMNGTLSTCITLPFFGLVDFGILFYPLSYILIIGVVNAVNLTDGIDGLCSCVTFVSMLGFLTLVSFLGQFVLSILPAALAGSLAGFLIWNFYPAKTFMGDTGSMFLGGAVAGLGYAMGRPEILFFFGAVYIWEAATVVIQVTYFKLTHGKRIFKMTPIHHSFEMRGWSEVKIDAGFSALAALFVALGLAFAFFFY